jgi:hypothetical protein
MAVEATMTSGGAYRLLTLTSLFQRAQGKEAAGLAIVRGTFVGLALLGVDTVVTDCRRWSSRRSASQRFRSPSQSDCRNSRAMSSATSGEIRIGLITFPSSSPRRFSRM